MAIPRKLITLSLEKKVEILNAVEQGVKKKSEIAAEYGIPRNTISTYLKNKEKIIAAYEKSKFEPARKRMQGSAIPEVEDALLIWMKTSRSANNIPISGPILQAKAEDLALKLGHSEFIVTTVLESKCTSDAAGDDSEEEDAPNLPCPTIQQAVDALEIIRQYVYSCENEPVIFETVSNLEEYFSIKLINRKKTQSKISDFFKK